MKQLDRLPPWGVVLLLAMTLAGVVGLEFYALSRGIDGVLLTAVVGGLLFVLGVPAGRASRGK